MDRLHGFSMMEDDRNAVILGNTMEVFAEKQRAGFVVGSLADSKREQLVFTDMRLVVRVRMLIDLMRELAGLPDVTTISSEPNPECGACGGRGYWWDGDGNEVDCAECRVGRNT